MRGYTTVVALSLLLAACGQPGSTGEPESGSLDGQTGSLCQDFIDATVMLGEQPDHAAYVETLNEAARPLYVFLDENDREIPQQVMMSWRELAYGEPSNDDLEAIEYAGGYLVSELGPVCEELGRNVGPTPLLTPDEAPSVELSPLYEEGTLDYACDVFIQTLYAWSDARSHGSEIGPQIADLTDALIDDLHTLGIESGVEDLAVYSEKYRTLPIVAASEEAETHLAAASSALAGESTVCGHMSTWDRDSSQDRVDVDYYRFRWEQLGFDDYTARVTINDPEALRTRRQLMVVVEDGVVEEVYDIRTSERVDPPPGVPLTVDQLFDAVASVDPEFVSFHPVLGYPMNLGKVALSDLSQGSDFDRSILGSTADATASVAAVAEFNPGRSCGAAHVPGGEPIPPVRPLDDDAKQALRALAAVEEEGGYFTSTFEYGIFERTDDTLVLLGEDGNGGLSDASFVRENGQWNPTGWGTCHWDDDGYVLAPWVLDPEAQLTPDSKETHLVVRDWCGLHTRYGTEWVVVATTTDPTIEIEVWQADSPPPPPDGPEFIDLGCSLGDVIQLTVRLHEPIGNRNVSGATDPADWPETP